MTVLPVTSIQRHRVRAPPSGLGTPFQRGFLSLIFTATCPRPGAGKAAAVRCHPSPKSSGASVLSFLHQGLGRLVGVVHNLTLGGHCALPTHPSRVGGAPSQTWGEQQAPASFADAPVRFQKSVRLCPGLGPSSAVMQSKGRSTTLLSGAREGTGHTRPAAAALARERTFERLQVCLGIVVGKTGTLKRKAAVEPRKNTRRWSGKLGQGKGC